MSSNSDTKHSVGPSSRTNPIPFLAGTLVMLTWPWIFFGIVWARGGVQLNNYAAYVARNNPHVTNYLVTFIGHIITMIVGFLLSSAVTCLAKEWVPKHQPLAVFDAISLQYFKNNKSPWGLRDARTHISDPKRFWFAVLPITTCFLAFTTVTSSITSLITPVPFNRNALLYGTSEIDFASNDPPDCLNWFNETTIPNTCEWKVNWSRLQCRGPH